MTSVLNVDTIAAKNGTDPVALTKQMAMKAWMNFDGGTSTAAITDSFNTSSIDDNGGGDYGANFTNSFDNATYVKSGLAEETTAGITDEDLHVGVGDKTASGDRFSTSDASDGTSARDAERCDVMYLGDLA